MKNRANLTENKQKSKLEKHKNVRKNVFFLANERFSRVHPGEGSTLSEVLAPTAHPPRPRLDLGGRTVYYNLLLSVWHLPRVPRPMAVKTRGMLHRSLRRSSPYGSPRVHLYWICTTFDIKIENTKINDNTNNSAHNLEKWKIQDIRSGIVTKKQFEKSVISTDKTSQNEQRNNIDHIQINDTKYNKMYQKSFQKQWSDINLMWKWIWMRANKIETMKLIHQNKRAKREQINAKFTIKFFKTHKTYIN